MTLAYLLQRVVCGIEVLYILFGKETRWYGWSVSVLMVTHLSVLDKRRRVTRTMDGEWLTTVPQTPSHCYSLLPCG